MIQSVITSCSTKFARFIFGKLPKGWSYPVVRGPLRGASFILGAAAGEGGGARVYFGLVEPEQTRIFRDRVQAGHTVFDIGANVGYYTLLGAKLVGGEGRVVAFEPAVRNLFYLYRHVVLNKAENVMIVPAACSNSCAPQIFAFGDNCALGHFDIMYEATGGVLSSRMDFRAGAVVPTVTVDKIVECTHMRPDILKIDVEGAELEVLQGSRDTLLKGKPEVFLSVHSASSCANCLVYLRQCGYVSKPIETDDLSASEWWATKTYVPEGEV